MRLLHDTTRQTILRTVDFFYPPFQRMMPLQTFRYAACGGFNTSLDIFLYFILYNYVLKKQVLDFGFIAVSPHIAAFLIAFVITFPTGFYLSRYVVWQQTTTRKRIQLTRYFLVVLACMVLNYIFLKTFVDGFGWYPTPSKILTAVFIIAFSYFSQRNFSFKDPSSKKSIDIDE
jgi:putative flippase GtrA